jgi:hypothetical protein
MLGFYDEVVFWASGSSSLMPSMHSAPCCQVLSWRGVVVLMGRATSQAKTEPFRAGRAFLFYRWSSFGRFFSQDLAFTLRGVDIGAPI